MYIPPDDTNTTRPSRDSASRGRSRRVSRWGPATCVAKHSSSPARVSVRASGSTPALCTSTSTGARSRAAPPRRAPSPGPTGRPPRPPRGRCRSRRAAREPRRCRAPRCGTAAPPRRRARPARAPSRSRSRSCRRSRDSAARSDRRRGRPGRTRASGSGSRCGRTTERSAGRPRARAHAHERRNGAHADTRFDRATARAVRRGRLACARACDVTPARSPRAARRPMRWNTQSSSGSARRRIPESSSRAS